MSLSLQQPENLIVFVMKPAVEMATNALREHHAAEIEKVKGDMMAMCKTHLENSHLVAQREVKTLVASKYLLFELSCIIQTYYKAEVSKETALPLG